MRFAPCFLERVAWLVLLVIGNGAWAQNSIQAMDRPVVIESVTLTEIGKPDRSKVVQLPVHAYRDKRELQSMRAVAEFDAPASVATTNWVVYSEKMHDGGTFSVNGVLIGGIPATTDKVTVRHLRPLMLDIPLGLLHEGRNVLVREWSVHENLLFLPRMVVGPRHALGAEFEQRNFGYTALPRASFILALVIALILFGLHWKNREHKQYLWVAASALGFCLVDLVFFVNTIPAEYFGYWQLLVYSAGSAITLGSYFFLLHACGIASLLYKRLALACAIAHSGLFIAHYWTSGLTYAPTLTRVGTIVSAIFALYPLFALVRCLLTQFRVQHLVFLLLALGGIAVNTLDFATIIGGRSAWGSGNLLQLLAIVWFLSMCFVLITDFSASLQSQRAHTMQLADELAEQKLELSRLHALERATQETQAAAQERARIMQDIHDGLGSQLVSSLAMAQAGGLSTTQTYDLLRSCIDDLRLAIDTSQDSIGSLSLALGNLRFRMQPRLNAAGIAMHWNTQDLSEPLPLRPEHHLSVLRMVQEIMANTLKHAQATALYVHVSNTARELVIDIRDDGKGFDPTDAALKARGKGLNNLDKRARALGAQLSISSSAEGTRTAWTVPLE